MKSEMVLLFVVAWIGCGVIANAGFNAMLRAEFARLFQSRTSAQRHKPFLIIAVIGGPITLLLISGFTRFFRYGLSFDYSAFPCTEETEANRKLWCDK